MPELPEVEVTRQSFGSRILGARVVAVRLGKGLRWPLGCEPDNLISKTVGEVTRRAKYLWLPLDEGGLLLHLGMSGSLIFSEQLTPQPGAHDHFDLVTTQGTLRMTDPRRFGAVVWSPSVEVGLVAKLLNGLGLEPFDAAFDGKYLQSALQRRRVSIKQALLCGDIVVGAGNIYACEALFASRIHPQTPSNSLSLPRCRKLADAIKATLANAVALGGSTLRDFRDAHGMAGSFQHQAWVYGREGEPCRVCRTAIHRIVQAQRSTFYCPKCQQC